VPSPHSIATRKPGQPGLESPGLRDLRAATIPAKTTKIRRSCVAECDLNPVILLGMRVSLFCHEVPMPGIGALNKPTQATQVHYMPIPNSLSLISGLNTLSAQVGSCSVPAGAKHTPKVSPVIQYYALITIMYCQQYVFFSFSALSGQQLGRRTSRQYLKCRTCHHHGPRRMSDLSIAFTVTLSPLLPGDVAGTVTTGAGGNRRSWTTLHRLLIESLQLLL